MHCDSKTFIDSSDAEHSIKHIDVTASLYGIKIKFYSPSPTNLAIIFNILQAIDVEPQMQFNCVFVRSTLSSTRNILRSLQELKSKQELSEQLFNDVVASCPNGHGGTMNLTLPSSAPVINPLASLNISQYIILNTPSNTFLFNIQTGRNQPEVENHSLKLDIPDDQIPSKYKCQLLFTIMSNPVYDPQHPQVFYERKNITRWLNNEGDYKNPFTRRYLSPTQLKDANILQLEIKEFVKAHTTRKKASNLPTKPACSVYLLLKNSRLFNAFASKQFEEIRNMGICQKSCARGHVSTPLK